MQVVLRLTWIILRGYHHRNHPGQYTLSIPCLKIELFEDGKGIRLSDNFGRKKDHDSPLEMGTASTHILTYEPPDIEGSRSTAGIRHFGEG